MDIPWGRVTAPPRLQRRYSAETSRGDAAAETRTFLRRRASRRRYAEAHAAALLRALLDCPRDAEIFHCGAVGVDAHRAFKAAAPTHFDVEKLSDSTRRRAELEEQPRRRRERSTEYPAGGHGGGASARRIIQLVGRIVGPKRDGRGSEGRSPFWLIFAASARGCLVPT